VAVAIRNALLVLGAAAVAVSASIHLHLWLDGYSAIATIGPLFLLQAIGGFALAIAILLLRRTALSLAGAGYLLATMTGFLLSVNVGLFGFQDTWSAPLATTAFAVEAAGSILLLAAAGRSSAQQTPWKLSSPRADLDAGTAEQRSRPWTRIGTSRPSR
jgi:hypothetical protein